MTTILSILSLVCIASYTAAVCIKQKGIPDSISATFYKLEHKEWFGFTMFATAGFLWPAMIELTPDRLQFIVFISCLGMFMIGAAPNFRGGIERPIHIVGAILCLVFSQVWVGIILPYMLLTWVLYFIFACYMIHKKWNGTLKSSFLKTNPMFYIEIVSLITVYFSVLL